MWEFEDGPDRGGYRTPVKPAKMPEPCTTVWPKAAPDPFGDVRRCRLCSIVTVIVNDQCCAGCVVEVEGDASGSDRRPVHTCVLEVEPKVASYRTHTGGERHRGYEVIPGDRCRDCNGPIDPEGFCEDCGADMEAVIERWFDDPRCPVCGMFEPAGGSTCPGPQDEVVRRGARRGSAGAGGGVAPEVAPRLSRGHTGPLAGLVSQR